LAGKDPTDWMTVEIPRTNVIENIIQNKIKYTKALVDDLRVRPRPSPKNLRGKAKVEGRDHIWEFRSSVFREYKQDTDKLRFKCFEFDWENSKLPNLIKNK